MRVHLVAQLARWRPDADTGPVVEAEVFGEEGGPPSIPGPLIRAMPSGPIALTISNTRDDTLLVIGFGRRLPGFTGDTLRVPPRETREFLVTAPASGTWSYFGAMRGPGPPRDGGAGLQLTGVLQAGPLRPGERLLGLNIWEARADSSRPQDPALVFWTINGRTWPSTERFAFDVGDTVRWRVVDLSGDEHPMHLHGFYFRVDGRTTWDTDTTYAPARRRMVVTEATAPGGSFAMTWVPTRPGAWLFHCHKAPHMGPLSHQSLNRDTTAMVMPAHATAEEHLRTAMGGLIIGITVRGPAAVDTAAPDRRIRLLVQRRPNAFGTRDGYGYIVQQGLAPASDSVVFPGPILAITRGELTEITVVNRLPFQTSVHWHGIELESYYDGVAGWSGVTGHLAPLIAPGDSFVVRMRPPRAGTFIYHTHVSELAQLNGGLVGALLVLEPGRRYDPSTDHVYLVHQGHSGDSLRVMANGSVSPPAMLARGGVTQRVRFINMLGDDAANVMLTADSTPMTWRPVAKDGAALPGVSAVPGPARLHFLPGETFDAEFTPVRGQPLVLRVRSFSAVTIPVRVE